MNQQVQANPNPQGTASIYDLFNRAGFSKIMTGFEGLDEQVRDVYNKDILRDSKALSLSAPIDDYRALEERIVSRLGSDQSYGIVAVNEVIGNYLDAITYINFLQKKSETDPKKVENLKLAVIKSLVERIPEHAERFVAEPEKGLYERALKELKSEKPI